MNNVKIVGNTGFVGILYLLGIVMIVVGFFYHSISLVQMVMLFVFMTLVQFVSIGLKSFSITIRDRELIVENNYFSYYKSTFLYDEIKEIRIRNDIGGKRIIIETKVRKSNFDLKNFSAKDLDLLVSTIKTLGIRVIYFD